MRTVNQRERVQQVLCVGAAPVSLLKLFGEIRIGRQPYGILPATALDRPLTVVLTAPMARKYFGDQDPLGRTILLENEHAFEVTGVAADLGLGRGADRGPDRRGPDRGRVPGHVRRHR